MADKQIENARKAPPAVAGHYNGLFTRDMEGAMAAVIVNPQASHSQRLAWALGQLLLVETVAEAAGTDVDGGSYNLASATRQLIEQVTAVIKGVVDEMEQPPEEKQAQPLHAV